MVVTGNRLNDGRILSNISFFDLNPGQHVSVDIKLRKDAPDTEIKGVIDLVALKRLIRDKNYPAAGEPDKGVILAFLEPEKEPSKHFLNDLPGLKADLDTWGGHLIFMITDSSKNSKVFNLPDYNGLPANSVSVNVEGIDVLKKIWISGSLPDKIYPLIILSDKKGDVLYKSSGYRIGIGDQILKILKH